VVFSVQRIDIIIKIIVFIVRKKKRTRREDPKARRRENVRIVSFL
jgi:hypothetical protein